MLEPGTEAAGYRIERRLGRGGMGVVYEATQLSLDRRVALKVLSPELSADPAFRERFRREGRLQAALDHPNIVAVYEAGELPEGLFLAMRLVRGETLKEALRAGPLPPDQALALLAPVAEALDAAHDAGLVHRDVKPQNILIAADGRPFLSDFGLTRGEDQTGFTRTGQFMGTLDYVAPEQIEGGAATAASDVYAFGAVLCEALTGSVPFPRDTDVALLWAHVNAPPPRMTEVRPDLPAALDGVVASAMAKRPEARPARASTVAAAASAAFAGGRAATVAETAPREVAATAPHDPAATAPHDPAATAPHDPAATAPHDPAATAPHDPAATASHDPAATAPHDPAATVPHDPAATAPHDPAATAPPSPPAVAPAGPSWANPPPGPAPPVGARRPRRPSEAGPAAPLPRRRRGGVVVAGVAAALLAAAAVVAIVSAGSSGSENSSPQPGGGTGGATTGAGGRDDAGSGETAAVRQVRAAVAAYGRDYSRGDVAALNASLAPGFAFQAVGYDPVGRTERLAVYRAQAGRDARAAVDASAAAVSGATSRAPTATARYEITCPTCETRSGTWTFTFARSGGSLTITRIVEAPDVRVPFFAPGTDLDVDAVATVDGGTVTVARGRYAPGRATDPLVLPLTDAGRSRLREGDEVTVEVEAGPASRSLTRTW